MALQHTKLADIQYVANAAASIYANPGSTKTHLKGVVLFNGNTATELVKLYVVPDSAGNVGTASAANQIAEVSLLTKETAYIPLGVDGHPFTLTDTNDSVQAVTTTGSVVTVLIIGDKEA